MQTFEGIVQLRTVCDEKILEIGKRASNARTLIHYMYSSPILKEITGHKHNKYYEFSPYLKIFMN
jgi:hypothetical protein